MNGSAEQQGGMTEAFSRFWGDFMKSLGSAGVAMPAGAAQDGAKQMQRIFFDALAKYADDFMRSPQFLEALRQNMANAMALRKQVDAFLSGALKAVQSPTQGDVQYTIELLHGIERRLGARLDDLSARVARLEGGRGAGGRAAGMGNGAARARGARRGGQRRREARRG